MRKILMIAMIITTLFLLGCENKYSDETYLIANASWVEDTENIVDFLNASGLDEEGEYDEDFLMQQILDGKINYVDKETKIEVMRELNVNGGKVLEIKIKQGRYKNKVVYTPAGFVRDLNQEREEKKRKQREAEEKEKARQAEIELQLAKEKERVEELAKEGKGAFGQNGIEIICMMTEGTNAYHKLVGKTNLPEGMRLTITISGIEKHTVVKEDKTFSALFERPNIFVGEYDLVIKTLDKDEQPANVQIFNDTFIEEKGTNILGKEIYLGRITIR